MRFGRKGNNPIYNAAAREMPDGFSANAGRARGLAKHQFALQLSFDRSVFLLNSEPDD
jgi:hypothetical protein